jgi:YD repeat-containing protein
MPFLLSALLLTPIMLGSAAAREDKKDKKSPLPDNATWELKAFDTLFRVIQTDYDAASRRVRWTVQTRDGHRTSDFVGALARKPFAFRFLDGDDKELAIVQLGKADFQGIPRASVMKAGTRLTITLDLPKAMPRTKKIVLRRE